MKKKWFLKGAIALGIAVGFSVNDVSAEKKYVFAAHELPAGGNKAGTVFYFPSVTIGVDKDGKEVVIMDTVAINEENGYGTPATAQGMDTTGFAYVVKITKPWAKNKAGEATLLSLKFGKKYDFKDANAKTITIPEFVWAHDKERSGDEAYPSYKITAVADTVLKALVVSIDGKITYFGGDKKASEGQFKELIISGNVPTVLGSGKIKDYGLLNDTTFRVKIVPSWAVLKDNKTVIAGSTFYDTAKAGVEGAESIVRDLNFGLSRDNRDLEVSKEDLATIVAFIAPATSPVQASGKDKGKLIKKSVATLFIGDNLKTIYKFTPTDGTEITINDRLPNKWLHLASNAFKADSLTWRFHNIIFGSEVSGNLGEAGFAALGGIPTLVDTASNKGDTSDFGKIDLSEVKLTTEEGGQFALEGEGLFEGLRIDTLNLPAKLKIVGNKWFKDATIDTLGATGLGKSLIAIGDEAFRNAFIGNGFTFLGNLGTAATYSKTSPTIDLTTIENGLTIGKAAFKGYNLWKYPIPAINQGATFDLGAFQRATVIGDSAFADITYGHLRFEEDGTIDEDNSFVSDTSSNGTKKNPPFYYFPVTNFDTLVHVQSLGQGVFANDRIHIKKEAASFDSTYYAIKLPFKILNKAQADVFKSVAFVTDGNPLAHDSLYKDTYKDTIPFHAFTFPIGVAPGAEISKNAFPDDTIYVYYTTFEKWKYALTGSKLVSDYGFEGRGEADANKWLVKIVTGSTGVVSNVKDGKRGEFEITYAFAHNSRARTISFYNAYQAAKRWYTIEGPESAKIATPGFLTEGKKEITEAFAEDGIVLDPFTPAGLYTIKVYDLDQKSGDSTYLLRILPADLARYKAEPVSLGYVGKENIVEALKHKFPNGLYFNIKNEYEEIEDLHHEAAEVKVYEEAALELKAGDEPSTSVLVVKGLGSYVNELPIELSYTARDLKDVTFDIAPVDFKIGEKEFKIPGDLKFTVIEGDTLYTLSVPQAKEGDEEGITSIAIEYKGAIGKPGDVPITLSGNGELTGSKDFSYQIKANWRDYAAFPTEGSDYKVSGLPKTFTGKAVEDLNGLVKPFLLTAGQYKVLATLETPKMYEKASDVEANKVEVYEAAKYDLYILPDGELKAKYTDAAYIGFYEIDKLKFEELKDAFIVGKDEEGAFTLTVDKDVYADEFGAILATTGDTFTVTIAEKAESSIDGLPGNPFKFAIPTAEPTALEAINLHFDGILYIVIGQTKDLNDYIKAKNKDAAIDFKSFISYSSDEPEKLSIEGSILTAVDKWNGEVTATYTKGSKTIKVTFPVKAVESEDKIPTSVESIVKGGKSVAFAGGELILKGFGGSVATVYGLNGGVVASFAVGSDDAAFGLGLGKGFYLVKVGSTVTKFIVK